MSLGDRAVYPRERGERVPGEIFCVTAAGLSPRTRGTELLDQPLAVFVRFIPANAGNGACRVGQQIARSVYPRERGERTEQLYLRAEEIGLSPRTRGTAPAIYAVCDRNRFIPANAGNGASRRPCNGFHPVYPRERGERPTLMSVASSHAGLSPRTRGTGAYMLEVTQQRRFIPANAGNGGAENVSASS